MSNVTVSRNEHSWSVCCGKCGTYEDTSTVSPKCCGACGSRVVAPVTTPEHIAAIEAAFEATGERLVLVAKEAASIWFQERAKGIAAAWN